MRYKIVKLEKFEGERRERGEEKEKRSEEANSKRVGLEKYDSPTSNRVRGAIPH
jgi:hypothetical protein